VVFGVMLPTQPAHFQWLAVIIMVGVNLGAPAHLTRFSAKGCGLDSSANLPVSNRHLSVFSVVRCTARSPIFAVVPIGFSAPLSSLLGVIVAVLLVLRDDFFAVFFVVGVVVLNLLFWVSGAPIVG
jgi:hypothetical protein